MTWMLRLYPPAWRRRYGAEFIDLIRTQPFSLATFVDVAAGAIDAWLSPQASAALRGATAGKEETQMLERTLKLRCAGQGPSLTLSDHLKSAGSILAGTLVLTLAWKWLLGRTAGNPYVFSLSSLAFLAPFMFSMRYTYLKGRSVRTQAVFIGGTLALVTLILLGAGGIAARR